MTERQQEKAKEALYAASFAESRKEKKVVENKSGYPWKVDLSIAVLFLLAVAACWFLSGCQKPKTVTKIATTAVFVDRDGYAHRSVLLGDGKLWEIAAKEEKRTEKPKFYSQDFSDLYVSSSWSK